MKEAGNEVKEFTLLGEWGIESSRKSNGRIYTLQREGMGEWKENDKDLLYFLIVAFYTNGSKKELQAILFFNHLYLENY